MAARSAWYAMVALLVGAFFVLLRPHEDAFTALDHSAYRLMGKAFGAGRGFHDVDRVLREVPRECRLGVMMLPSMDERNSRDRSFLVRSLASCETEPFFYPLLPLCAVWFDRLVPGPAYDYFVPICGCLLLLAMFVVATRGGGPLGGALALALFFGSPVLTWCFRGFYAESVGSVLIGMAVLGVLSAPTSRAVFFIGSFALGLATSFHPVLFVPASIVFASLLIGAETGVGRRLLGGGLCFIAGVLPLIVMTAWVCAPYGGLGLGNFLLNFKVSASHRIATVFAGACLVAMVGLVMARPLFLRWADRRRSLASILGAVVFAIVAVVPMALALRVWSEAPLVREGLRELWGGIRWPFGVLLALGAGCVLWSGTWRARFLLAGTLAIAPVFAYLKGAEQMGLWSQRRLLPLLVMGCAVVIPAGAATVAHWAAACGRRRAWAIGGISAALMAAGAANALRWPAPYWVRVDQGADAWVAGLRQDLGSRLTLFDYYPYSVPLAVDGKTRALGLGESARKQVPELMRWLSGIARREPVVVVTAYANPGVEDELALVETGMRSVTLDRVKSKGALPAERALRTVSVTLLRAEPLSPDRAPPALHKIFDGGPLALRGPWGRAEMSLTAPGGSKVPAMWSREGSGVVGPVPPVGGSVRVVLDAAAARAEAQTLLIQPPWSTNSVPVIVPSKYTEAEVMIPRLASAQEEPAPPSRTGIYRLRSRAPYDPEGEGIHGFERDLGVLVHAIDIAVE